MSSTAQQPAKRWRRLKKLGLVAVIGGGLLVTAALVATTIWPPINDVATGITAEYPDVQPQVLRYSPELVLERAVEAIDALSRWQVVDRDDASGRIDAEVKSVAFGFTDDVTVDIEAYGVGSLVNVRSRSRVGRFDFGQNARNIWRFQGALEEHLQLARQVQ